MSRAKRRKLENELSRLRQHLLDFVPPTPQPLDGFQVAMRPSLSKEQLKACMTLFEKNMSGLYRESSWGLSLTAKASELAQQNARYVLVTSRLDPKTPLVGFCHYRFEYDDEELPTCLVLYIYEIQVDSTYQRRNIGRYLMNLMESVALSAGISKIMLTVFTSNETAMNFYTKKLHYEIDRTSPSQCGNEADYEIMSKHLR